MYTKKKNTEYQFKGNVCHFEKFAYLLYCVLLEKDIDTFVSVQNRTTNEATS